MKKRKRKEKKHMKWVESALTEWKSIKIRKEKKREPVDVCGVEYVGDVERTENRSCVDCALSSNRSQKFNLNESHLYNFDDRIFFSSLLLSFLTTPLCSALILVMFIYCVKRKIENKHLVKIYTEKHNHTKYLFLFDFSNQFFFLSLLLLLRIHFAMASHISKI